MPSADTVNTGRQSGCPFCLARRRPRPDVGTRIILLDDFRAGMTGTVSRVDVDGLRRSAFLMIEDGAAPGIETIVDTERELFAPLGASEPLPNWLPPLSLGDAAILDEVAVWFCDRCSTSGVFAWDITSFYEVIRVCWLKRLPLTPAEVSAVLSAHGLPPEINLQAQKAFAEGTGLLVYTHGRRPIKKKRVAPLFELGRS